MATFADDGPKVVFNSSSLPLDQTLNLSVQGLTVLQQGADNALYGPLPTPIEELVGLVHKIRLLSLNSNDKRILRHGRLTTLWILVNRNDLPWILTQWAFLESSINAVLSAFSFRSDSDLFKEKFLQINDQIEKIFYRLEERTQHKNDNANMNPFLQVVGGVPELQSTVRIIIHPRKETCYVLIDDATLAREMKNDVNHPFKWLHWIQNTVREHQGKWHAVRIVTDSHQQEALIKRLQHGSL